MSLRTLTDVKLRLDQSEKELFEIAKRKLGKTPQYFAIKKKSLDARDKNNIRFVYAIEFSAQKQTPKAEVVETLPKYKLPKEKVLVVGSGPAGLFCALRLIERGIAPIVIERGLPVEEREKSIDGFFTTRVLDTESNVQFGEGGAGTFSDGKLNTQTHDGFNRKVIETFARFGAPEEILYLNKPHIGSDNLKRVVKNIREYIIAQGGEVRFSTKLDDIKIENGKVKEVTLVSVKTGEREYLPVSALSLAVGHSARDTVEKLYRRGVEMRAKDFAVGVRIEHLQEKIAFAQYGNAYKQLPPAEYKLVAHTSERSAFTFCMCPGGVVIPSASEENGVVVNGMSYFARDGKNANSALIAQVRKEDFGDGVLDGIEFQRKIERQAFVCGGSDYRAPVQLVGDFLKDRESSRFGEVTPTYALKTQFADMRSVLPDFVTETLKSALLQMDKRLRGFASEDALLTGAETRTSSPVRMERDSESLQSVSVAGLYPCGEGAGYAGGITSSAVDGVKVADAIYLALLNG